MIIKLDNNICQHLLINNCEMIVRGYIDDFTDFTDLQSSKFTVSNKA